MCLLSWHLEREMLKNSMLVLCVGYYWLCLERYYKKEMSSEENWLVYKQKSSPEILAMVGLEKPTVSRFQKVEFKKSLNSKPPPKNVKLLGADQNEGVTFQIWKVACIKSWKQ